MYNKQLDKEITAIYPWFKITNSGNVNLDLSKLELRYYYTIDLDEEEDIVIDWSNIGKERIVAEIKSIEDKENADRYLSIKTNSTNQLVVGNELEIHSRFNKRSWSLYNQENDYSFNKESIDYIEWNKILVLYDGNIIAGEEPQVNDGLQLINLEAERRKNVVSLKWDEIKDGNYLVEQSKDGNNFIEVNKDLMANFYIDVTAEELEDDYYYRVVVFNKNGDKIGKSKKIKVNSFKDSDQDGLSEEEEIKLGTDINNEDTDEDGLNDGEEVLTYETNSLEKDTDNDGLDDFFEVYILNTSPLEADTDKNGILDYDEDLDQDNLTNKEELELETNPKEKDSDFDGISDKEEIYEYKTKSNEKDSDGDGVDDGLEIQLNLNPNNKDSNGNGVLDGDEVIEYNYEVKESEADKSVKVKVNGEFVTKHIDDIVIFNMEGSHVMTSKETPGYLGAPYLVKIPNGSNDVQLKFIYNFKLKNGDVNPTLYRLDKEKNTLIEVEGQGKSENGIVTLKLDNIEKSIPENIDIQSKEYYEGNFILLDKTSWDKYWETEIKHPLEKGKLDLAFVIDTSGSMSSNDRNKNRVNLAKHFIEKKADEDRMALVGFSSYSKLYQNLTADKNALINNVDYLGLASGGTDISAGVDAGINQLKNNDGREKK